MEGTRHVVAHVPLVVVRDLAWEEATTEGDAVGALVFSSPSTRPLPQLCFPLPLVGQVGEREGDREGSVVGRAVGNKVGKTVGEKVGRVGFAVGVVGGAVGGVGAAEVGFAVAVVGTAVVGDTDVGAEVGSVGAALVGLAEVGASVVGAAEVGEREGVVGVPVEEGLAEHCPMPAIACESESSLHSKDADVGGYVGLFSQQQVGAEVGDGPTCAKVAPQKELE